VVLLLDAQRRVIATEGRFAGALTETSVDPRAVLKLTGDVAVHGSNSLVPRADTRKSRATSLF
jgi:hypothetical protein